MELYYVDFKTTRRQTSYSYPQLKTVDEKDDESLEYKKGEDMINLACLFNLEYKEDVAINRGTQLKIHATTNNNANQS